MRALKQIALTFVTVWISACLIYPATVRAENSSENQVKQIIESMIAAYGGKTEISKVTTVVAKGTIIDFMKEKQGDYARYYSRPGKLRIDIMPDQEGETRILSAGRGWRGSPETLREVQNAPLQAMIYQYSYLDLPMGLADGSYQVNYAGNKVFKGRMVDVLEINLKGASKLLLFVDREKHLILRVSSEFKMGMGSSELSTEYADFRPVGNVLFPFRLNNYAGETMLSTITLFHIQTNATIPPNLFTPGKISSP